jgi:hypothetical protein
MIHLSAKPLHDWRRHHPTARRIAADMLACRDVLNLRTRRLVRDIQQRDKVAICTARTAVAIARKAAA